MKKFLAAAAMLASLAGLHTMVCAAQAPYALQSRGGIIACYDEASGGWSSTGRPVSSLPNDADRRALEAGLSFSSRQALTRALEDYCS